MSNFHNVKEFQGWFEQHITLSGKPYTLDSDQARAVFDDHKNTLVTARAGSGKTRVIVAKVAYLIAQHLATIDEIAVFMFNRTAATEVNQRIGAVEIDGVPLKDFVHRREIRVASTFHKFALDTVKSAGERPELISELDQSRLIRQSVNQLLAEQNRKLPLQAYQELLRLVSSFITRAGQKYSGENGLKTLCQDINQYIAQHQADDNYHTNIFIHRLALSAYEDYLLALNLPRIDFNILMSRATRLLNVQDSTEGIIAQNLTSAQQKVSKLKYLLVDEYQDFSYLFFSIIQAIRSVCPDAHLFAVGDDWQAINRFAGSDVNYFINFAKYFPEDTINIPLRTNYRSDRRIVEHANKYMLKNYDHKAQPAILFSKKSGKIKLLNYAKAKFDTSDLYEDALGDARFQLALAKVYGGAPEKYKDPARLLKLTAKLIQKHRREQILLLHRHNFTSFPGVTLENFLASLKIYLLEQNVLTESAFASQIRCMTMHKSKGLESDVVILLELNRDQILSTHPHATIFEIFGDTLAAERADQQRLLYVALTRAKHRLYLLTSDDKSPI